MKVENRRLAEISPVSFKPQFDEGPGRYRIGMIILSIGKPVVTGIQAMFWQCVRSVGYIDAIPGYARLLSSH